MGMIYTIHPARFPEAEMLQHVVRFEDITRDTSLDTRKRLSDAHLPKKCHLRAVGHKYMAEYISAPVRTVTFHPDWLPRGTWRHLTDMEIRKLKEL